MNFALLFHVTNKIFEFTWIRCLISRFNDTHHHLLQVLLRNDIISEIRREIIPLCRKYSHRLERMNMCQENLSTLKY